ncbi:hypothetical protein [Flavobacterium suncheonense]|uniref:Lipoprotein n=1 Tax=Flavobacterium suncheonense GH29-5 = DSM 17707 TaxID=1121899 RepID=A0A0A2M307_9FLAO|nr:hypothetical protein [Flavobacterium suncheonense]KGO85853.1 hypothetical protein Q764_13905 [Flavobacterium suncheonense GH29-5 = DSM 17707]
MKTILIIIASFLLFSCKKNEKIKVFDKTKIDNQILTDSVIIFSNIPTIKTQYDFSENEAKDCLYKHFKKKGIKQNSQIKGDLSETENELFIDYDTIYKINSEKSMAVITYWIAPAYSSGHCILPYRAIISKNQKGLRISNEEFIPQNFYIDSLINDKLYVSDVECANSITKRKYRITLK